MWGLIDAKQFLNYADCRRAGQIRCKNCTLRTKRTQYAEKRDIREGAGGHRRGEIQVMAVPFNDHNKPEPQPITMIPGSTSTNEHTRNPKIMAAEPAHEIPTSDLEQDVRCRRGEGGNRVRGKGVIGLFSHTITHFAGLPLLHKYVSGVLGCPQAQARPVWMCDEGVVSIIGGGEARRKIV